MKYFLQFSTYPHLILFRRFVYDIPACTDPVAAGRVLLGGAVRAGGGAGIPGQYPRWIVPVCKIIKENRREGTVCSRDVVGSPLL